MRNFGLDQRQDFTQPSPTMQPPPAAFRSATAPTPGTQRSVAVLGPTLRFKGKLSAEAAGVPLSAEETERMFGPKS
jgi:hypothetical protein